MPRSLPNMVITGTPGVGKSTTCAQLVSQTADTPYALRHLDINQVIREHKCHDGFDEELKSWIVDEDRLCDEVEKILFPVKRGDEGGNEEEEEGEGKGGWILDYHACDLFPESWVDLVVVLRCADTEVFHDRLVARGYGERKLQENIDSEIFGVVAEEAREGFDQACVVELSSEKVEDVEENCARIVEWVEKWVEMNNKEESKS